MVDARVLAASNKDMNQALKEGKFREDLYYRLGVVTLSLPPLRERGEDIVLLATAELQRYAHENGKKITGFTPQAIHSIRTYLWPGNVRELENRIKRAVIMAEGSKVTPMDLELSSPYMKYEGQGLREAREALEKDLIEKSLAKNRRNITRVA